MKVGTAAKVFLGKNEMTAEFSGIQIGTDVILGKAEGRTKDLSGLVLSNYLMLGKGISRAVIATVYGVPPLSLPNAIASSLYSLKAFGGTEHVPETYIDEVTADGKCEQSNIPVGYTELEYIQSSGTQYINTGVSGNATIKITAQASTIKGSSQALLSSTPAAQGGTWFGEFTTNQKWGIGSGNGLTTIDPTTKMTAEITFDGSGCSGTVNGESITRSATITQGGWTIGAGVSGTTLNYPFSGKVWSCKITQDGVVVRNFIPAKRNSDNEIGMYDIVSDAFFTNSGTGTFIAGPEARPVLPEGYIQREFIYMLDGSYLLTDLIPTYNGRIEMEFQTTSFPNIGSTFIGARSTNQPGDGLSLGCSASSYVVFDGFGGNRYTSSTAQYATNTIYKYVWDNNVATLYQGTTTVDTKTFAGTGTTTHPLAINGLNNSGSVIGNIAGIYLYSFKMWNGNGELIADYVPAVRGYPTAAGFYDMVSKSFKGATSGSFTAGPEYERKPTPTTDAPIDIVCNNGVLKYGQYGDNLTTGVSITTGFTIDDNGAPVSTGNDGCYTDYIEVLPNTTYTLSVTRPNSTIYTRVCEYNSSQTFTSLLVKNLDRVTGAETNTFTTTANAKYVRIGAPINISDLSLKETGIYTVGTTETITDALSNTATCERLLSVGDYKDTQAVVAGTVTRNVGIKVLDGTENWQSAGNNTGVYIKLGDAGSFVAGIGYCTHSIINPNGPNVVDMNQNEFCLYSNGNMSFKNAHTTGANNTTVWTNYLAAQYAAGTPIIVVYALTTSTTETVTGQFLSKSPVTYAGSLTGLTGTVTETSHTVPTPAQPLDINTNNGVLKYGNVSKNLFDEDYKNLSSNFVYLPIYLGVGTYTCSFSLPNQETNASMIYFFKGQVSSGASNGTNQVDASYSRTVTSTDGYVTIAYRNGNNLYLTGQVPSDYNCMIEKGSTATSYEPYRLAVYADGTVETIQVTGKNIFNKNNLTRIYGYIATTGGPWTYAGSEYSVRVPCLPNTTYTARYNGNSTQTVLSFASTSSDAIPTSGNPVVVTSSIRQDTPTINTPITITTGASDKWLIVAYNAAEPQNTDMANNLQIEIGSTATDYQSYHSDIATCEDLLSIGDYTDEQEVIAGNVTRKIGVKVLDGTESWSIDGVSATYGTNFKIEISDAKLWTLNSTEGICNKFNAVSDSVGKASIPTWCFRGSSASKAYWFRSNLHTTTTEWQQWLSAQYTAGTPVIVVYPLATETTETVTGQPMSTTEGDNTAEITQASMDGLELEVKYYKKP